MMAKRIWTPILALLTVRLSLCSVGVATAAFPGKNGRISFLSWSTVFDTPRGSQTRALEDVLPTGSSRRTLHFCTVSFERPNRGECSLFAEDGGSAYSASGRLLTFAAPDNRVGVMNEDGSQVRFYPVPAQNVRDPTWSPDGKRIVFTGFTDRGGEEQTVTSTSSIYDKPGASADTPLRGAQLVLTRSHRIRQAEQGGDPAPHLFHPSGRQAAKAGHAVKRRGTGLVA